MEGNEVRHTDLDKMNRQLAEQEQIVEVAYARLGKAYYDKYQTNPEVWTQEIVSDIRSELGKLDEIKERILELKGIRLCPSCGQEIPLESVFCSNCGSVLQAKKNHEAPEGTLVCRQCGCVIRPGQKFCIRCGARIDQPQENERFEMKLQETVTPEQKIITDDFREDKETNILQSTPSKNICPNCKKVYPDDMRFCTSCGSKLIRE